MHHVNDGPHNYRKGIECVCLCVCVCVCVGGSHVEVRGPSLAAPEMTGVSPDMKAPNTH